MNKFVSLSHSLFLRLSLAVFAAVSLAACSGSDDGPSSSAETNTNSNLSNPNPVVHRLEFPRVKGGQSLVVTHYDKGEVNYSVEWDSVRRSARWSAYEMYSSNRETHTSRYYPDGDDPQYPTDPDLHCSTA